MTTWCAFQLNDELDVLEVKLGTLDEVVDRFVIAESPLTHAGRPKPMHLEENWERFAPWHDKILHVTYAASPQAGIWARERDQRSTLSQAIGAEWDDLVMVSDCDEIPNPAYWDKMVEIAEAGGVAVPRLSMHVLGLRWRWPDTWPGGCRMCTGATLHTRFRSDVDQLFNTYNQDVEALWQNDTSRVLGPAVAPGWGWHLAYMGGVEGVQAKLASFAHQEFNVPPYNDPEHIARCIETGADLLNRPERQAVPACKAELPTYLQQHEELRGRLW